MISPASEVDTDELEGQSAASLMVFAIVLVFVLSPVALGPRLFADGATGVLMEGLSAKLGAAVAHMDGFGVATLLNDRCHPLELGHFGGAGEPLAMGADGTNTPGGQARHAPPELC